MALKIRLKQLGRNNLRMYRLVVTDSRTFRDGKYVEAVGTYNPLAHSQEQELAVDAARISYWLANGAELTEKAVSLVKRAAPAVLREYQERVLAKRVKLCEKRKTARRKAKAV